MPRLAMCHVCATLTRLPDPPEKAPLVPARWEWEDERGHREEFTFRDEAGQPVMVAQYDPALEDWVERHLHQDIPETTRKHDIWGVDDLTWQTTDVVSHEQADRRAQLVFGLNGDDRVRLGANQISNVHTCLQFSSAHLST